MNTQPFQRNVRSLRFALVGVLASSHLCHAADYQWDVNGAAALGGNGTWNTTNAFWDDLSTGLNDGTDTTQAVTFSVSHTAYPRADTSVTSNLNVTGNFALCRVIGITMINSNLTVDCEEAAGYAYDLQRSTDLSTWTPCDTNLIAPPDGKINYVEEPATATTAFYRLKLH